MVLNRRRIFVGSLLLWISYGLIFPVWIGKFHDLKEPRYLGGTFGLSHEHVANGSPFAAFLLVNRLSSNELNVVQSPIWSPPPQMGGGTPKALLWPWQRPSQSQHVEISVMILFIQWSVGIIAIGFVYRITSWISPSSTPDSLLSICRSLSFLFSHTFASSYWVWFQWAMH